MYTPTEAKATWAHLEISIMKHKAPRIGAVLSFAHEQVKTVTLPTLPYSSHLVQNISQVFAHFLQDLYPDFKHNREHPFVKSAIRGSKKVCAVGLRTTTVPNGMYRPIVWLPYLCC
jgi:hypothetical protein